jgi:DNA-directed RNA polymerase subunit RPC12/RpoP
MAPRMAVEDMSGRSVLRCPECRKESVHRVPCLTLKEQVKNLLFVSPFRCQVCGHRFLAFRLGRHYPPVSERRTHERIPVRLDLAFSGGRIKGEGTLINISLGGCLIETTAPVKADDIFHVKLFVNDQEPAIEVAAMVRSIGAKGVGMKFVRSARENRRLIAYLRSQGIE